MKRRIPFLMIALSALLAAVLVLTAPGTAQENREAGTIELFNGKNLEGWRVYLDPSKNADPEKIWRVEDGVIHCEGSVNGYIITEKEYGDYVLKVQWKWGEKMTGRNRNSGVFVHVSGPDKIWPKGVEAQLAADHAGDFWLVGDFKLKVDPSRQDPRVSRHFLRTKDKVEKPVGEWNQYEITCKGDTVKLAVNGQVVNEGTDAEASKGKILLQSEGAEIYFRNITLTPMK